MVKTMQLLSLVTSQNVTAPKPCLQRRAWPYRLVTSQNVTAPKPCLILKQFIQSLVTSQNVTAPKHRPAVYRQTFV